MKPISTSQRTKSKSIEESSNTDENKQTNALLRKRESLKDSVFTCFYCYYLLISLEKSIKIVLNRNSKQGSKPNDYMRNFVCLSISIGNTILFEHGSTYSIFYDENKDLNTIQFNENKSPIMETESKSKYYLDTSCKIQQHLMIHKINELLNSYKLEISYYSRKPTDSSLSKILLHSFIDIDKEGKYVKVQKPIITKINENTDAHIKYNKLCEILNKIFFHFLDNRTGKTKQLIITDDKQDETKPTKDCIVLTRNQFLEIVHRMRYNNEEIDCILETLSKEDNNSQNESTYFNDYKPKAPSIFQLN